MSSSKYTFEDYLAFIENELGLQLLDCQKEMLKKTCENKTCYYVPARHCGWSMFNAARILLEQLRYGDLENYNYSNMRFGIAKEKTIGGYKITENDDGSSSFVYVGGDDK